MTLEFSPMPKIARLSRPVIITEKLDGTNASIYIGEDEAFLIGSRKRWITPEADNYGFARWATANKDELLRLGPGHHFGEWWGNGIQRGYGLKEKRFSLFNVSRWSDDSVRPACCSIVPTLYQEMFTTQAVEDALNNLREFGSQAAPGYMKPEGVIVFHTQNYTLFKKTLEGDEHKEQNQ